MSGLRTGIGAAVIAAALLVCSAGSAPAQGADPASGTLASGVAYRVRPDPAQPGAAVALWYRAPSGGFGDVRTPGLSRLAAATIAASTPITGTSLVQLIDRWGGRLSVAAYPDTLSITALVPPNRVAQTVRAMTADYFAPVVGAAGLQAAQRDVGDDAAYRSFWPDAIEDALGAALFAAGPLHDGTLGTAKSLNAVSLERVRAFADRAFRPANAILILTGNVDAAALRNVASRPGTAEPAPPERAAVQTPGTPGAALRREGNIAGTGLGWIGPPIADEADATALDFVADLLFVPKTGLVPKALGASKATVTGKFVTYRSPGIFLVTLSGEGAAEARPLVEQAIAGAAKPLPAAAFAAARAAFVYRLLGQMETPSEIADTYGWYAVEGAPVYAPAEGGLQGRYFTLAAGLTPDAVAAVVAKYLVPPPAVVTLVKQAPVARSRT